MRSTEIGIGEMYAVDHQFEDRRPPQVAGETFPRWEAEVRDTAGSGRWMVRLVGPGLEVEVRSVAIEEPWTDYVERKKRQRNAKERVMSKRLTWEDLQRGVPCPGCGRPYVDDAPRVLSFINSVRAVERLLDGGAAPDSELDNNVRELLLTNELAHYEEDDLIPTVRARAALRATQEDEQWRAGHQCPDDIPRSSWFRCGNGPLHCSGCCPPPPLSPQQEEELVRILARAPKGGPPTD